MPGMVPGGARLPGGRFQFRAEPAHPRPGKSQSIDMSLKVFTCV